MRPTVRHQPAVVAARHAVTHAAHDNTHAAHHTADDATDEPADKPADDHPDPGGLGDPGLAAADDVIDALTGSTSGWSG